MSQQGAHLVRDFGAQDVFEFAGARFDLVFIVDGKDIHEKALRKPMPAYHIARAGMTLRRETLFAILNSDESNLLHGRHEPFPLNRRKVVRFDVASKFTLHPEMFEHFIEILIFFG